MHYVVHTGLRLAILYLSQARIKGLYCHIELLADLVKLTVEKTIALSYLLSGMTSWVFKGALCGQAVHLQQGLEYRAAW